MQAEIREALGGGLPRRLQELQGLGDEKYAEFEGIIQPQRILERFALLRTELVEIR